MVEDASRWRFIPADFYCSPSQAQAQRWRRLRRDAEEEASSSVVALRRSVKRVRNAYERNKIQIERTLKKGLIG